MGDSRRATADSNPGNIPRPARGPIGEGALVLKRSKGLVCGVAGCPVGDVWPGGSEAKMSEASKSFAEDWQGGEGGRRVTEARDKHICLLLFTPKLTSA